MTEEQAERIAVALESIAGSMGKLTAGNSDFAGLPGIAFNLHKLTLLLSRQATLKARHEAGLLTADDEAELAKRESEKRN